MIELKNVSVTYPDGKKAVDNISLKVNGDESVALIGANGAGKTSLIMAMVGVLPSEGEIYIDDILLSKKTENNVRNHLGIVFQNPDDQLFMPTVYEDIAFGLRNLGLDNSEIKERISKYLKITNIENLENKSSLKLSGGEKRMSALATVLAMEPKNVVYDEPTAFLDPKARRNLINTLNRLDQTQLIATHDLTFALEVCHRTVLIKNGKIFADGISKELLFDEQLMDSCDVEAIRKYM